MKVILIGNYLPDRQRSMIAFANLLHESLLARGLDVELLTPHPYLGGLLRHRMPAPLRKWLAYVDKFILFPPRLLSKKRKVQNAEAVFHIVDHSNAMYGRHLKKSACVITCHDMLAVRGGLGDAGAYCPASPAGAFLQKWILSSLKAIPHIACVSETTRHDLERLISRSRDIGIKTVPNAVNAPFSPMPVEEIQKRLPRPIRDLLPLPYLLTVGSSQLRKNRKTAIRTLNHLQGLWSGRLVVAGQRLSDDERQLAVSLNLIDQIIEVEAPDHQQLNALYSGAHALLFPSYAEGFGWPITEAQATECPVICSDRASVPEVAGDAALIYDADDSEGFAQGILRLAEEPDLRASLIEKGRRNLERFSTKKMLDGYMELYQRALTEFR